MSERNLAFCKNLRFYRERQCWTQQQLAEKIGYSEKSISKWEKGNGLPPLETAVQLAFLFGISMDEMLFEKNDSVFFLGIDGGGTKTLFRLQDEEGHILRSILKGPCNPNDIGMENTLSLLEEGIRECCRGVSFRQITLFAGISGGGLTGDHAKTLHRHFEKYGFFAFENGSDIENLLALAEEDPCLLAIMGTGFIVYGVHKKQRIRAAGWGQFFDEGGCGYTLGRDAIAAALQEEDGSGEKTLISSFIREKAGASAAAHLAVFYERGKSYIASFQDTVFLAAKEGDAIARGILEKNMAYAARMIAAAARQLPQTPSLPVFLAGGLCGQKDILFPLLEKHLSPARFRLIHMEKEPVEGAILLAQRLYHEKSSQLLIGKEESSC